ncbi:MAG TPA: mannitol dehydrogenase family protein [Steroidobacteraceae bacterium]|nr:mannitol dehydrogenase family protein [Steroidobacteraceae bacterium]
MTLGRPASTTGSGSGRGPDLARLSDRTLDRGSRQLIRPDYRRAQTRIGTVHFGPGAFHRAHQAYYFDRLLEKDATRAVCAISLKTASVRDALAPQDGLYTLVELDETPTLRAIGAIREILVAAESPAAVGRRLCDPDTSLVTMTVTEKGYCLDGAGGLDFANPDIVHDLSRPEAPRSLIGWLVRGLELRRERGLPPYLVVCCDNLSSNGPTVRRAVLAFAARRDARLAAWIEETARFPRTMVDSITPATDQALRERVAQATGLEDAWPVQRERFVQWVVEEVDFPGQPDWASVDVTVSRDVTAYERAKLRLLNGAHSTLAYAGLLAGLQTVAEAMAQPALRTFIERMMVEDIEPTLVVPQPGALAAYRRSILRRFENPAMRHQLAQIAWDGSQKLPIRILGTVADTLRAGRPLARLMVPVAAWMHFVRTRARDGVEIVDPLSPQLAVLGRQLTGNAAHDLPSFFALPGVFPAVLIADPRFTRALSEAYEVIAARGALATVTAAASSAAGGAPE